MAYKYLDNAVKSIEYQLSSAYSHGYQAGWKYQTETIDGEVTEEEVEEL